MFVTTDMRKFGFIYFLKEFGIEEDEFTHTSSFVGKVDYEPDLQEMRISLNNIVYEYCFVPENIFEEFEAATSKGSYYNENIKGKFVC
jgi:hypothetical protein